MSGCQGKGSLSKDWGCDENERKGKEFPQKRSRSVLSRDLMDIVPCSFRNALKSNSDKNQEQRSHFDCYHYTGSQPSFSG